MKLTTVGLDLAKQVFSVHGVDEHGKAVLRKRVSRGKLLELFAQLPSSLVGMQACSGAHYWARGAVGPPGGDHGSALRSAVSEEPEERRQRCRGDLRGGEPPQHVARAGEEHRAEGLLVLHRVRQGLTTERAGAINQLRGLLSASAATGGWA